MSDLIHDTTPTWDPDACAAAGAALLDANPDWTGWRDRIDRDALDMADGIYRGQPGCRACVGAQLDYHRQPPELEAEGDYATFLFALAPVGDRDERRAWAVAHGFVVPEAQDYPYNPSGEEAAFERLTAAWRTLLARSPA